MEHNIPQPYPSDEFDLRELVQTLWTSKFLIILSTLVFISAAITYAFFSTPIYETHVQTLPATPSGLASYNMANQLSGPAITAITHSSERSTGIDNAIPALTPEEAYKVFLQHVVSATLRQQFFNDTYLPAQPQNKSKADRERLWKRFNEDLTIKVPKTSDGPQLMTVTLNGTEPETIAAWANQYVNIAAETTRKQLLQNLGSAISVRRQSIDDQITTLRKSAKAERQNTIARLKEALALAQSIGLENPPNTGNLITSYTGSTTYLRGTKALSSELALLEKRASDDPYIPELPDLLKKKLLLQRIDLSPQHLSVATIDQSASVPQDPVKPKKGLILAVGFILGGILGVMLALTRHMLRPR